MAKLFTESEWKLIFAELAGNQGAYGLPARDDTVSDHMPIWVRLAMPQ